MDYDYPAISKAIECQLKQARRAQDCNCWRKAIHNALTILSILESENQRKLLIHYRNELNKAIYLSKEST